MKIIIPILALLGLVGGSLPSAQAQETIIVPWTSTWTYDVTDLNYDSLWRTVGYDDSAWASGPAPLGFPGGEATPIGAVSTGTTFADRGPLTVLFRHEFNYAGDPGAVSLVISNVADDGALVFINGTRVADFGAIDNGVDPVTKDTEATRGGESAGRIDVTSAVGTLLVVGVNVLAVEVHQDAPGSSDVVQGTALSTIPAFGPVFDLHPQDDLDVVAGQGFILTANANGAPAPTYQWFYDVDGPGGSPASPMLDETSSTLTVPNADVSRTGFYFVRATGHVGSVDSDLAEVIVSSDTFPPVLLYAVGASDRITITLTVDEPLESDPLQSATEDPFAYALQEIGGPEALFFGSAALVNETNVVLTISPGMMSLDKEYELVVFGGFVTDLAGNAIDYPDNTTPVLTTRIAIELDAVWQFDESGTDLGTDWLLPGAPAFANSGPGILGQETDGEAFPLIMTDLTAPNEGGPNGHYFRTTFTIPDLSTLVSLTADYYVDDQAALYINGVEVLRTTAEGDPPIPGTPGTPIPFGTQPTTTVGSAALTSGAAIPIDSVVEGNNTLSVYVAQGGGNSSDVVWGLILTAVGGGNPTLGFITQPVTPVNIDEGETINLSVIATGIPPLEYQWRRNGVNLTGETNASLSIAGAVPANSGNYDVVLGDASAAAPVTSSASVVTVAADDTAATVLSAAGDATGTNITITLSEGITGQSATNGATYSVFRRTDLSPVTIHAVVFDPANPTVIVLNTDLLGSQLNYDLTVAGFVDLAVAMNVSGSSTHQICALVGMFGTGHVWKYDQRDVDLGTAWREVAYDDSAWPSGPSTLGFEDNLVIATPLLQIYNDGVSVTNTQETLTYYFRTTVDLPALGVGDSLSVDVNYDDSFIMYLNGVEVARASITATGAALTHETAGNSHEADGYETFELDLSGVTLVDGDNTLAVEIHQTNRGSSDAVLDVRLNALIKDQQEPIGPPSNVVASVNPVSGTVDEGDTVTFTVSSGGAQPQTYEWFRDSGGGAVSVGTGPVLTITDATPADNGEYTVEATNDLGSDTSPAVTLTVIAETNRPTVVTCVGHADLTTITLLFDEVLDPATAQDTGNYVVEGMVSGPLAVSSAVLSVDGTSVTLTTGARTAAENYSVTISGVVDASFNGNAINPDPSVCKLALELLGVGIGWDWSYRDDDVVQPHDWVSLAFDDSTWPVGPSILGFEADLEGQINTPFDRIYTNTVTMVTNTTQTLTFYFRTHFSGAGHAAGNDLVASGRFDDAVIIYLNGVEAGREGVDAGISRTGGSTPEEVHAAPGVSHESDFIDTVVLDGSGLVVGDNLIAIEVHQQNATSSDAIMGLGVYSVMPPPPACTPEDPTIVDNGDGTVTVTWAGLGVLHSSATVNGTYTLVLGAVSPAVITKTTAMAFFQVVCP